MNIALVEDDMKEVDLINGYCRQFETETGNSCAVTHFGDGLAFLDGYKPVYDVIFMDIEMPYMNGMDAARKLRGFDSSVIIVFITNLKQFALKGYEVEALDFLVKPVEYSSFKTMLARVYRRVGAKPAEYLSITNTRGTYRIRIADIYYLESVKHFVVIHTAEGETQFFGALTDMESKLPASSFARCNSCYLVNLAWVKKVDSLDVYVGNDVLKMSKGKKEGFMLKLLENMNG
ncbi:MAG: LytTR family DNA-binding domain-containing protein [Clostridia bacterium]|nr:LytTR family DNA-binding domain-containing protein [Clostridia bacterium]